MVLIASRRPFSYSFPGTDIYRISVQYRRGGEARVPPKGGGRATGQMPQGNAQGNAQGNTQPPSGGPSLQPVLNPCLTRA